MTNKEIKLTEQQQKLVNKFRSLNNNFEVYNWVNTQKQAYSDWYITECFVLFFTWPIIQQLKFEEQKEIFEATRNFLMRTYNNNYLKNFEEVISNPTHPKNKVLKNYFKKQDVFFQDPSEDFKKSFPTNEISIANQRFLDLSYLMSVVKTVLIFFEKNNLTIENFEEVMKQFRVFMEKLKVGILTCSQVIDIYQKSSLDKIADPSQRNLAIFNINHEVAYRRDIDEQHQNFGAYVWKLHGAGDFWKTILPYCFESSVALSSFTNSYTFDEENKPLTYWLDSQVLASLLSNPNNRLHNNEIKEIKNESEVRYILANDELISPTNINKVKMLVDQVEFSNDKKNLFNRHPHKFEVLDKTKNSESIVLEKELEVYDDLLEPEKVKIKKHNQSI